MLSLLFPPLSIAVLAVIVRFGPLDPPEGRLPPPGTAVLDTRGAVLSRDMKAGLRLPVPLPQVAPLLQEATIAAEDRRFFHHPGVDPLAIARALLSWGEPAAGGASTITQQLARRLYLTDYAGPPLLRKLREALLALQIEARRSKEEILSLYLNSVYYGRGAYGVEAAARIYFGARARDLELAQAALLAGLPQLPVAYDPVAEPRAAQGRQRYVLGRLAAAGRISPEQAEAAAAEPLAVVGVAPEAVAPHFVAYALEELEDVRPDLARLAGQVIETTLDAGLQREAERIVRRRLEEIRDRGAGNAAVVALDPATGHILALVGSAGFFDEEIGGQVNMALQPRQPGSALKPFLYAAALERGFSAATPLLDVPTAFQTPAGTYAPGNFDRHFHGVVPLRVALASSYNVPAVRTLNELGVDALLEMAHRVGLRTLNASETYGLALTLGGGAVRLLDLAAAYGAIANGGSLVEPVAVTRFRDGAGRVRYEAKQAPARRVLSPEHAYILGDILSDPAARVPGFGEVNPLTLSARAGVKTGTSAGSRDSWTVGFTPDLVVGVWVGNTDGRPMENLSSVDAASPIWRDVMEVALRTTPRRWPDPPPALARQAVCTPTGLLPGPHCPMVVEDWFPAGADPATAETYYLLDEAGRLAMSPPAGARAWAREAGLPLASSTQEAPDPVYIAHPAPGSVFFLAAELPAQELLMRATVPSGATEVQFRLDGRLIARLPATDPDLVWSLEPGAHRLEVVALLAGGRTATASSTFEVRPR